MALFGEFALEKLLTCGKRDYVMMGENKTNLHSKDSVRESKIMKSASISETNR
jgi:hypothetical protein